MPLMKSSVLDPPPALQPEFYFISTPLVAHAQTEQRRTLVAKSTSANGKLAAIKEAFRLAGVQEPMPARSDKSDLVEFLKGMGLNVENVGLSK